MASLELPQTAQPQPQQQEATGGGSGASDSVLVHPYLFPSPIKAPAQSGKTLAKQLKPLLSKEGEKEGGAFLQALDQARLAFTSALTSATVGDAAVNDAATKYIGLLLGLVSSSAAPAKDGDAAAGAAAASPDAALAAAEAGAGAAASPLAGTPSKLRHAAQWEWSDGALFALAPGAPPRKAASNDAAFELASSLVAYALRLMHAAALAAQDSASGVATPASTRAYNLLRQAAGVLEAAAREALPALPAAPSTDLDLQAVRGLATLALADAQQLTMLRAVAKGNQPQLISAIAADTQQLYQQAGGELSASSKLAAYCAYKQHYCGGYAHTFNGIALWKADKPGDGLKSLEAAAASLAEAKRAAGSYDAAPPATLNLHHRRVDEELERVLADTQRRVKKENDAVFMQRVPAEVPPLPEGKRLAAPTAFALPPPAKEVQEGVVERCFSAGPQAPTQAPGVVAMHSGGAAAAGAVAAAAAPAAGGATEAAGEAKQGCSCCRWTVWLLTAPILLALWLVGAVLWVVLLPLKCCCPCCGIPIGWLMDAVLGLLALPARALRWAAGSPFEEKQEGEGGGKK